MDGWARLDQLMAALGNCTLAGGFTLNTGKSRDFVISSSYIIKKDPYDLTIPAFVPAIRPWWFSLLMREVRCERTRP